jgi:hypothetical protein
MKKHCATCSACIPITPTEGQCRRSPPSVQPVGFEKPKLIGGKPQMPMPLMSSYWPYIAILEFGCRDGWQASSPETDVHGRAEAVEAVRAGRTPAPANVIRLSD